MVWPTSAEELRGGKRLDVAAALCAGSVVKCTQQRQRCATSLDYRTIARPLCKKLPFFAGTDPLHKLSPSREPTTAIIITANLGSTRIATIRSAHHFESSRYTTTIRVCVRFDTPRTRHHNDSSIQPSSKFNSSPHSRRSYSRQCPIWKTLKRVKTCIFQEDIAVKVNRCRSCKYD